jgi:hypothetical protein
MKLGDGITTHATEEARIKWEGREKTERKKKGGCPACEIEAMAREAREKDYQDNLSEESKE